MLRAVLVHDLTLVFLEGKLIPRGLRELDAGTEASIVYMTAENLDLGVLEFVLDDAVLLFLYF